MEVLSAAPTPRPQEQACDCRRRHTVLHCHSAQVRRCRAVRGAGDQDKTSIPVWEKQLSASEKGSEQVRFKALKAGSFDASQTLLLPTPCPHRIHSTPRCSSSPARRWERERTDQVLANKIPWAKPGQQPVSSLESQQKSSSSDCSVAS